MSKKPKILNWIQHSSIILEHVSNSKISGYHQGEYQFSSVHLIIRDNGSIWVLMYLLFFGPKKRLLVALAIEDHVIGRISVFFCICFGNIFESSLYIWNFLQAFWEAWSPSVNDLVTAVHVMMRAVLGQHFHLGVKHCHFFSMRQFSALFPSFDANSFNLKRQNSISLVAIQSPNLGLESSQIKY